MRYTLLLILLFILTTIFLLFLLLIRLFATLLVRLATDRKMGKKTSSKARLVKITKSEEFVNFLIEKGDSLETKETENVTISGYGGVSLVGHILYSKTPKRVIIAFHGWRGSWSRDFGLVSDFWNSADATVIYIEQRGQRDSGGEYITFGLCERYDVIEWVKWAGDRFASLPIYLCGVSMGASSVLMSSSLGLTDRVHGIIADSGFTSPTDIWRYIFSTNFRLPYRLCERAANRECQKRIGQLPDSCSTINALKECRVPVLFIHGAEDSFVPPEMTYLNFTACSSPKRLYVVPGANHCMAYYLDQKGYENEMLEFFKQYD